MELPSWTPDWLRRLLANALVLLDKILDFFREKLSFLKPWSPTWAPKHWIYINGSCCIFTFMFFLLGWMEEKSLGYQFAEDWYVPYNLLICGIWFLEAALWILFDRSSPAWHKLGELGLAFFFVFDGILYLYEWKFSGVPLERKEILIYTVIDFCIYLFYLMLAIREEAKATTTTNHQSSEEQFATTSPPNQDIEKDGSAHPETEADFKIMT